MDPLPCSSTRRIGAALLALALSAFPLVAQTDDQENDDVTGWVWHTGQTVAQVTSLTNTGYRLIELDVATASPLTFDVVAVPNTGSYQKSWAWYFDLTWAQVLAQLYTNNARPIDIAGYETANGRRFAVVMVGNGGAGGKTFWTFQGYTPAQLSSLVQSTGGRLVDLDSYALLSVRLYEGILLANTGADARNWGYFFGVPSATVGQQLSNGYRVYDLQRVGSDQYDCVVTKGGPAYKHWTLLGVSQAQLISTYNQIGARIARVERYLVSPLPPTYAYNATLINNSNALTTAMSELLRAGTDGSSGVYLRQLNGPVLASLQADKTFEPASTIKTLFHVHAMKQVTLNQITLTTQIPTGFSASGSCWSKTSNETSPLEQALQLMMENSDNQMTIAVQDKFTNTAIQATAGALQMTSTQVLRDKCQGPLNTATLVDFGKLHEAVANGYLVYRSTDYAAAFRRLMLDQVTNYAGSGGKNLASIVSEEAATLNLPAAVVGDFTAAMQIAHKGGFYDRGGIYHASQFAWIQLPFRVGPQILPRQYVTGVYVDLASDGTKAGDTTNLVAREVLRGVIHDALATWKNYVPGGVTRLGTGCPGSLGAMVDAVVGRTEIGQTLSYQLTNVKPGAFVSGQLGFSSTNWGGLPLPFDLTPLQAPGCRIFNDLYLGFSRVASTTGAVTASVPIPNVQGLIGASYHFQWLVVDSGANALGIAVSDATTTKLGGYP